jgi:hypothetical protein
MWCTLTPNQKQELINEAIRLADTPVPQAFYLGNIVWTTYGEKVNDCQDLRNNDDFYQNKAIIEGIGKHILPMTQYDLVYHSALPGVQFSISDYRPFWIDILYSDTEYLDTMMRMNVKYNITTEFHTSVDGQYLLHRNIRINGYPIVYLRSGLHYGFISDKYGYVFKSLVNVLINEIDKLQWEQVLSEISEYLPVPDEIDPLPNNLKEFTPQNVEQLRQESVRLISQDWKVHVQFKPEYVYWGLTKLYPFVNSNREITDIKVSISYGRSGQNTGALPIVILYLHSRIDMVKIVNDLVRLFSDPQEYSLGVVPRFNVRVNDLIYYAQGHGDLKQWLYDRGTIDKYFDKRTNYGTLL